MDLEAMFERCKRDQWAISDLDWSGTPRPMAKADEMAIVQYFTDMAGIERLAKALFAQQAKNARDPVLRDIFRTFVADEERHAVVAERLAVYYDVHRYQKYEMSRALQRFAPSFVHLVQNVPPDIANVYVTGGEIALDMALLRSIDDYVNDAMSQAAMDRINRDESRHLAIDYHMTEYYASAEYAALVANEPPASWTKRARSAMALARVVYSAAPFFRAVFFDPMQRVDPDGKRLREAFKRLQLLGEKNRERASTLVRVLCGVQALYNESSLFRRVFGRAAARICGIPVQLMDRFYTQEEARRAAKMSYDDLANEALAADSFSSFSWDRPTPRPRSATCP
ncbi:hypothetical protein [Pendulispora albinea]|uniref:Ferritin-like domain-containing protein n=1 Tax=Pendulispora albinea TaxID=2741071 RepID=A0ABZ2M8R5_9BACT